MPLLLSDHLYRAWRRYDGKRVRVGGVALERGRDDLATLDLIRYRDRWLSPDICGESDLALYVDTIALAGNRGRDGEAR